MYFYISKIITMLAFKALPCFFVFLPHREHKVRAQVVPHAIPTPLMVHQNGEPLQGFPSIIPIVHHFFIFMAFFSPSFLRENILVFSTIFMSGKNPRKNRHLRSESILVEAPRWGNPDGKGWGHRHVNCNIVEEG